MRTTIITLLVLIVSVCAYSEDTKKVNSDIKDVTIFLTGAQITRVAKTNVEAGTTILQFNNLPAEINENTIQVKASGNVTILSVKRLLDYLGSEEKPQQIKMLKDSLKVLKEKLDYETAMLYVCNKEEAMLNSNLTIGGQNTGVNVNELKAATEFFKSRMEDIKKRALTINHNISNLNEKITRLENQLNSRSNNNRQATSQILISLSSKTNALINIQLSYLVNSAGWTPAYDIRVNDVKNPVELSCKALVYQSSGEPWNNVKLTLSTGNPYISGTKPVLSPWSLYFEEPRVNVSRTMSYKSAEAPAPSASMDKKASDEDLAGNVSERAPVPVTVQENTTSLEFNIDIPWTILSDGKENSVDIRKLNLPATYEYQCVPKLDKDAFLMAKVTGWEDLNLLSGNSNLYFENTYIGQAFIDVASVKDTLLLSLGRDKNIVINRTMLKDYSEKKTLGMSKKETKTWEIEIRNKKKEAISLIIEDQFPLTTNKDIEVELLETSNAQVNKDEGKLVWKLNIDPANTTKLKFGYSVKYPKNKIVRID